MKVQPANALHARPLELDVQLLYHPIGLVGAVAHWICEEGMHVDTGRVVLEHLTEVEITFPHRRKERTDYHRILAHVSHRAEGKTHLRFVRCSRAAHQALREVVASITPRSPLPAEGL